MIPIIACIEVFDSQTGYPIPPGTPIFLGASSEIVVKITEACLSTSHPANVDWTDSSITVEGTIDEADIHEVWFYQGHRRIETALGAADVRISVSEAGGDDVVDFGGDAAWFGSRSHGGWSSPPPRRAAAPTG